LNIRSVALRQIFSSKILLLVFAALFRTFTKPTIANVIFRVRKAVSRWYQ